VWRAACPPFAFFFFKNLATFFLPSVSKIERQGKWRKIPGTAEGSRGRKNTLFHIDFSETYVIKSHRCENSIETLGKNWKRHMCALLTD